MNHLIDSQIQGIIVTLKAFNQNCKMAAIRDDQCLDKNEEKTLKKIDKATEKYIRELEKLRR